MTTARNESLPPEPTGEATQDELEADIERTREHLGATVDALANKFDVKAQARDKFEGAKQRAGELASVAKEKEALVASKVKQSAADHRGAAKPEISIGVVAVVGLVAALFVIRWRRNAR